MAMQIHEVTGGGGLRLHVREWGDSAAPPILFIHGWSQSHLCWKKQYESPLAERFRLVAFDLRGHGMSDAPLGAENYTEERFWAEDVAAIIDRLRLDRPVVVGSSYGGYVICDYLRSYGATGIAGINFVGAAVTLGQSALGTRIGPGFLDHVIGATSDDLPTNIQTMRAFVRACVARPLPPDELETAICWNMVVPAPIRAALVARQIDSDDVLSTLTVPVLMTQGQEDRVILPAMGEHILSTCPDVGASWFPGTGHMPFLEDPMRFNTELSQFVQKARAGTASAAGPRVPGGSGLDPNRSPSNPT